MSDSERAQVDEGKGTLLEQCLDDSERALSEGCGSDQVEEPVSVEPPLFQNHLPDLDDLERATGGHLPLPQGVVISPEF